MKINNQNLKITNAHIFFYYTFFSSLSILFLYLDFITYVYLLFLYIPCLPYPDLRCHYRDRKLSQNLPHLWLLFFKKKKKTHFQKFFIFLLYTNPSSNLLFHRVIPSRNPQPSLNTTMQPDSVLIILSNVTQRECISNNK